VDGPSDDALMARVARGDGAACRVLVDRHLAPVTAFARRLLGNQADAEDVAQETFLRLWSKAGDWRPGGARLTTWLHRVALNQCRDRGRRRPMAPLEAVPDAADPRPPPADAVQRREVAARVERALAALPERQRTAIVLCHHQGLSNAQAGEVLGIGVEAVESLLARGRRALRHALAAEAPDLLGDVQ